MIDLTIKGDPMAWKRARRLGARYFTDPRMATYQRMLRGALWRHISEWRPMGAVGCRLAFGMPIPASWSKNRRSEALAGVYGHTSKPDLDNLAKMVLDALQGVLWADDAAVTQLTLSKFWTAEPFTRIEVWDAKKPVDVALGMVA